MRALFKTKKTECCDFEKLIFREHLPKEPEKSTFGLGQSPYNRRSQVGSLDDNTTYLAIEPRGFGAVY